MCTCVTCVPVHVPDVQNFLACARSVLAPPCNPAGLATSLQFLQSGSQNPDVAALGRAPTRDIQHAGKTIAGAGYRAILVGKQ